MRGAFHLKAGRYPWSKAVSASLSMGLALLCGSLLGNLEWGLLTSMGAFTALYVQNEPYFQRAMKLALVAFGLALSFGLGSLSAGAIWTMALALGGVSAISTFLCGAWKVPVPSAYFFILACAVGTGLPVQLSSVPLRTELALMGGGIAWLISMSGWLINAHGPETSAVVNAYRALDRFLSTIGKAENDSNRDSAALALRAAEQAVLAGELRWRSSKEGHRLFLLVEKANSLFLTAIELSLEQVPLTPALAATVRALADTVPDPDRAESLVIPRPTLSTPARERMFLILSESVKIASYDWPPTTIDKMTRQKARTIISSAFSKHSLVVPATLRIGIAVLIATLIAALLGNQRPYWVPLTVASVLQGGTIIGGLQRTVQRAIGTSIGILLGGAIFAWHPQAALMIPVIMALQLIIELMIVRNYALAVVFITPIPLLLAEMGQVGMSPAVLVRARLFDTLFGCILGVIAILFLWHRASSVRIRTVFSETLRHLAELFFASADYPVAEKRQGKFELLQKQRLRLQTGLINLHMVYESAMNEFPRKASPTMLWPAVVATQRLGYLVLAMSEHRQDRPSLSNHEVACVRGTMLALANCAEQGQPVDTPFCPLPQYPTIEEELHALQESLGLVQ